MMSDDDRDIDIESDDGDDSDSKLRNSNNTQYYSQAEKRAHHNALERKRRDHIKDSFTNLRDAVPTLQGEKVASRAQILKKAADYIISMRRISNCTQKEIADLEKEVLIMRTKVEELEKSMGLTRAETLAICGPFTDSEDSDSSETTETNRQSKKLKMASLHH